MARHRARTGRQVAQDGHGPRHTVGIVLAPADPSGREVLGHRSVERRALGAATAVTARLRAGTVGQRGEIPGMPRLVQAGFSLRF